MSVKVTFTAGKTNFEFDAVTDEEASAAVTIATDLSKAAELAPDIFKRINEVQQAGFAVGATAAKASTNTPNVTPQAATAPPSDGTPSCPHGPMKDLLGKLNGKGEPYRFRYYCAADFNDPTRCANGGGRNS